MPIQPPRKQGIERGTLGVSGPGLRLLTVPDVQPLVEHVYRKASGGSGCCLHVVLDDLNVRDRDLDFAIGFAVERGHKDCEALARILRRMSRTQRLRLAHRRQLDDGCGPHFSNNCSNTDTAGDS